MLLSHEKIQKQSFGKQLLKDIENFAVLARSFGSKKLSGMLCVNLDFIIHAT